MSQGISQLKTLKGYDKVIVRLGGHRSFENPSCQRVAGYLSKMAKCFAIIATNEKLRDIAATVNDNVYVIPNGLDLNLWEFKERPLRNENYLRVGFVGNVTSEEKSEYKGYEIVKQACQQLGFSLVRALYSNQQIRHSQMQKKIYDKIDILVLPTDGEGCSNTIMECLACGVPVITTRMAGYHGEKMIHNKNILFCNKNCLSLSYQLEKVNKNRDLISEIAVEGRKFAEENHDIVKISKQYEEIIFSCFKNQEKKKKKRRELQMEIKIQEQKTRKKLLQEYNRTAIVCVLKSGGDFTIDYVKRLRNMIERNTTLPYEFICLSDLDIDPTICKSIKLILDHNHNGWWSKIELFRPNLINTKRIMYFDLDNVILSNIDDILAYQYDFIALKPWNKQNRNAGMGCSSIMGWKNDSSYSFIYDQFELENIGEYPKGDQQYISKMLISHNKPFVFYQDITNGIYSYKRNCRNGLPKNARIVGFHGRPRPSGVKEDWLMENWK